jgi:Family of unknown function (DUF5362)
MEDQLQLLQLTNIAKNHLISMSKWGKFLSIANFIMGGTIIIGSLFLGRYLETIIPASGSKVPFNTLPVIIFYMFIGFIIALPGFFLLSFSRKVGNALYSENDTLLEESLSSLNTYFTINGIIMVLSLLFYALVIIGMVIGLSTLKR